MITNRKREVVESAVVVGFAFIAGSTRMIEVFPHSTLKRLLLSASTGSFCSLASKQIINEKNELKTMDSSHNFLHC